MHLINNSYLQILSYRNVGLLYSVNREFFQDITNSKKKLEEDHINSYLSILSTDPQFAGVGPTDKNIAITSCFFMVRIYTNVQTTYSTNIVLNRTSY